MHNIRDDIPARSSHLGCVFLRRGKCGRAANPTNSVPVSCKSLEELRGPPRLAAGVAMFRWRALNKCAVLSGGGCERE